MLDTYPASSFYAAFLKDFNVLSAIDQCVSSLSVSHFSTEFSRENAWILSHALEQGDSSRQFIERIFRLMSSARFDPRDCTSSLAWVLGRMMPSFFPDAWGGSIPPFTDSGRHEAIDRYLKSNRWSSMKPGMAMLEMGCGFPAKTAIDAANAFPNCTIVGADPNIPDYLLHDQSGSYACLRDNGAVTYFHAPDQRGSSMLGLYQNSAASIQHFERLFEELAPHIDQQAPTHSCQTIERDGAVLVRGPAFDAYAPNLTLRRAAIGDDLGRFDVVRCFNVLYYFDGIFRRNAEQWVARALREGGIFICGGDSARTLDAQYCVYQKRDGVLVPREFSISVGNIRPLTISPWFAMVDDDKESRSSAILVGTLRASDTFRLRHDRRLDELLAHARLWERDPEGYLAAPRGQRPPEEWSAARADVHRRLDEAGIVDEAIRTLNERGFQAWRNEVGHIAVDPTALSCYAA